jgi:peptide/nickel transport system substrate-binding protein
MKPVGSGPYTLSKHDSQQVGLTRDDKYWGTTLYGGLPKPQVINHPIFKSNDEGDLAFQNGQIDVSQQFTPQVWKMWEDKKKPISTWFHKAPYDVPGSIPMLVLNTTKKGLNNAQVRRALAHGIDYAQIAKTAMSSYSVPANSSVILPTGSEAKYFSKDNVATNGWKFDVKEAARIMEQDLHAKKGSDGIYRLPDGTRMGPWTAITPTGWTDWQGALQIVASSAKAIGFDIKTQFPQAPQVTEAVQNGDFDLACWSVSGVSAASPWQRFRDVLDNRGVAALGKSAFYNYGRFKDPAVPGLLDKVATTPESGLKDLYAELDKIFMKNAPMIPLMYRPSEFFEYNESTWTGFPNAEHPNGGSPQFAGAGNQWLYMIKPVSKS